MCGEETHDASCLRDGHLVSEISHFMHHSATCVQACFVATGKAGFYVRMVSMDTRIHVCKCVVQQMDVNT